MNQIDEELFPEMVAPPPAPVLQDDIEDDEDFIEDEDPLIPEVTERQKIDTTEIFKKPNKNKNIKPIIKDVGLSDEYNDDSSDGHMCEEPPTIKAITEPKTPRPKTSTISEEFDNTTTSSGGGATSGNSRSSGKSRTSTTTKPKRQMSESQKAKLAEARAKALAVRKANAEKRKQEREEAKIEKDLERQVRNKKINKMKSELNDEPVVTPTKPVQKMYSQEDLDNAILKGIAGYDRVRKAQKEEKKKRKEEEEHKKKIFNTISNAVGTGNPEIDQWSICFQ